MFPRNGIMFLSILVLDFDGHLHRLGQYFDTTYCQHLHANDILLNYSDYFYSFSGEIL